MFKRMVRDRNTSLYPGLPTYKYDFIAFIKCFTPLSDTFLCTVFSLGFIKRAREIDENALIILRLFPQQVIPCPRP